MVERQKVRTYISQAYWCNPQKLYSFEKAKLDLPGSGDQADDTAWLDELFDGGIVIPGKKSRAGRTNALTILITGPPGTGKTTLATELAYRWCTTDAWKAVLGDAKRPRIVYVSSESKAPWVINNAKSLGWDTSSVFDAQDTEASQIEFGKVRILDYPTSKELKEFATAIANDTWMGALKEFLGKSGGLKAEVVIVDSLNTMAQPSDRSEVFTTLLSWVSAGPQILVLVLDSSPTSPVADIWEFASDIVLRLDRKYDESGHTGYMIRSIEILKARYQKHVWGRHQLKIHEGSPLKETVPKKGKIKDQDASDRMRAHPYRKEGGVFIFPSIHYILSLYKRHAPTGLDVSIESCVPNLNRLLGRGYPKGRCTALIGLRGGHKSHLAYEELLSRILPEKNGKREIDRSQKALVVSLRDDEGLTKETLQNILERSRVTDAKNRLTELQQEGLLEITYFPPGYITPEEFFHRVLLSIKRLKSPGTTRAASKPHVSLLFNSLEQLSSRFPLCAKESIFIPGIIQMLTAEEVSSFFVTAIDNQSKDTYGLETMAELILDFSRRMCGVEEYLEHAKIAYVMQEGDEETLRSKAWTDRQVVVLKVGRYAGGQAAGAEGILELVEKEKGHPLEHLEQTRDLVFMPSTGIKRRPPMMAEVLEEVIQSSR